MYKTPLTDCSTVHTVGFRHLETRPVVSTFRFQKSIRSPRHNFSVLQVLPTQVPPLGGCCIWGPAG
ncbi:hypothetical protein V1477_013503 [Vespula maculifrons]|uniref:Uncharacterized protein n=1 Tax=Vespula maculifrons TaxID=7453 RepID=A0ABD2BEM5_VESMC